MIIVIREDSDNYGKKEWLGFAIHEVSWEFLVLLWIFVFSLLKMYKLEVLERKFPILFI